MSAQTFPHTKYTEIHRNTQIKEDMFNNSIDAQKVTYYAILICVHSNMVDANRYTTDMPEFETLWHATNLYHGIYSICLLSIKLIYFLLNNKPIDISVITFVLVLFDPITYIVLVVDFILQA
ncbi:hypothetical protein ACJX0J_035456 [Zea mays]